MIEKQTISGRDVWVEIQQQPANRSNPNTIPTEYFTARYFFDESQLSHSKWLTDESGETKLFESPVAALSFVTKEIEKDQNSGQAGGIR